MSCCKVKKFKSFSRTCMAQREGKEQSTNGLAGRKDRTELVKDRDDQETKKTKHDINSNDKYCVKKSGDVSKPVVVHGNCAHISFDGFQGGNFSFVNNATGK